MRRLLEAIGATLIVCCEQVQHERGRERRLAARFSALKKEPAKAPQLVVVDSLPREEREHQLDLPR